MYLWNIYYIRRVYIHMYTLKYTIHVCGSIQYKMLLTTETLISIRLAVVSLPARSAGACVALRSI